MHAKAEHELACAVSRLAEAKPEAERCKAVERAAALKAKAAEARADRLSLQALRRTATPELANAARAAARQSAALAAAAARGLCEARGTIHAATADVATAKRALQCTSSTPAPDIAAPVLEKPHSPPSPPTVITTPSLDQHSPPSPHADLLRVEISLRQQIPPPPSTGHLQMVAPRTAGIDGECEQELGNHGNGECGMSKDKEIAWLEECEREHRNACESKGSMYGVSEHDRQRELRAIWWLEDREREHDSEYDEGEVQREREAIDWLKEPEHEHESSDTERDESDVYDYNSFDEYYLLYE